MCGVYPNFILVAVVYIALSEEKIIAEIMGFLFGLTMDVFSTGILGLKTVIFTAIGYVFGRAFIYFDKNKIIVQFMVVFLANVVYLISFGLIYFLFSEGNNIDNFYSTIFLKCAEAVITAVSTPMVFYVLNCLRWYI
jgi:rod shape-determining protein MreD